MRLLLVEDDARIALPTARALRDAGHEVQTAPDGVQGLHAARSGGHDALLLDVMLPGHSGFELARILREEGAQTPIIFLTARTGLNDRVEGLDLGGDAYLTKPFELPELLATLRAVVRRGESARSARVSFGDGAGLLDARHRQVWWRGEAIGLTAREYALLETLVLAQGRWFTREELLARVWGPDFGGEARVVDVYISYLRRKLSPDALNSARGLGYRLP
ncbi:MULTISPECIES: response regulator transcription factor [Deinococcus]|uniref:Response regulator transcription factor n=1 Tax=Deinococcus rufus TaxID=2136097 RepID=A0ABV7Z694_9DEIO|nr:response regulator transcription factor [Deinococcus sp. AB2017081]WQE97234.1 response regulator transcription factor [Deinococcus sp. AB2017081]